MFSIVKLFAAAAALLVVLPSASATCVTQEISVYAGTLGNWNSTSNLMNQAISSGVFDDIANQNNDKLEVCSISCPSAVVIKVVLETWKSRFFIAVNGRYLLTDYTWSSQQGTTLPRPSFHSTGIPSNVLWINIDTRSAASSTAPKYFTGQYLNRYDWFGYKQPIYAVPFPHWICPAAGQPGSYGNQINYIQVANDLNYQNHDCTDSAQLKSKRYCQVAVRGDPQFAGLRGQDYQVHGIDGAVYNIISAPALNVNSRFVWLDGPRDCPIMPSTGKKSVACWAHKGSYLDNLAMINNAGAKIFIQSGPAKTGLVAVEVDGKPVKMGAPISFGDHESLHFNSTHEVTVVAGVFTMVIENSDGFVNLRSVGVKAEDWEQLKNDDTHGLLGQTWRKTSSKKVVEGRVDDYLIESGELFSSDFMYNRYKAIKA